MFLVSGHFAGNGLLLQYANRGHGSRFPRGGGGGSKWLFLPFGECLTEQFWGINAKGGGEFGNLGVRHPADLAFDPGNDVAAHVPAGDVQLGGKSGLGDPPFRAVGGFLPCPSPSTIQLWDFSRLGST
jgi:hypothetical protein